MKLLKVSFENINSLKGKWSVDFETAEKKSEAFVISGPTGAGKSSILDAVTLALYGRTGRQEKVTVSTNHIMTKETTSCYAEVTFIGSDGNCYRAKWSQRMRPRKGGLDSPVVTIARVGEKDTAIEEHKSTKDQIEKLVGLDFDQFTRAVVLEQGQFDSFLKAKDNERADILEKATKTGHFSVAGRKIYLLYAQSKKEKERLFASLEELKKRAGDLSEEAQKLLQEEQEAQSEKSEAIKKELAELRLEERWIRERESQERQAIDLTKEQENLRGKIEGFEVKRVEYERALKARESDKEFSKLEKLRVIGHGVVQRRENLEHMLEKNNRDKPVVEEELRNKELQKSKVYLESKKKREVIEQARKQELDLQELQGRKQGFERAVGSHEKQIAVLEKRICETKDLLKEKKALNAIVRKYLEGGEIGEEWGRFSLIQAIRQEAESVRAEQTEIKNVRIVGEKVRIAQKKMEEAQKHQEIAEPGLKLAERNAEDHLEAVRQIAKLENFLDQLKDGEPCPLCGSCEHPSPCKGEADERIKEAKKRVDEARKAIKDEEEVCKQSEKAYHQAKDEYDIVKDRHTKAIVLKAEATGKVESQKAALQADIEHLEDGVIKTEGECKEIREALEVARKELEQIDKEYREVAKVRFERLRGTVEEEEKKVRQDEQKADADYNRAFGKSKELTAKIEEQTKMLESIKTEEKAAEEEIKKGGKEFLQAIQKNGFAGEALWVESRMEEMVFQRTDKEHKEIEKEAERLKAQEEILQKQMAEHEKKRPETMHENLEREIQEKEDEREVTATNLGKIQSRMEQMKRDAKEYREKEKAFEISNERYEKLKRLNGWLGGEHGEKFRAFAQGVTLRQLLNASNGALNKMSKGRYELRWNPASNDLLTPEVIDHEQCNEIRAVSNLSGGETFMVSLSLALGLGKLTGEELSIESLFLDEGFGTLDAEKLSLAISTLMNGDDKRRIGIITHVEALKDSFDLDRIDVIPQGNGHSILRGCGVSGSSDN